MLSSLVIVVVVSSLVVLSSLVIVVALTLVKVVVLPCDNGHAFPCATGTVVPATHGLNFFDSSLNTFFVVEHFDGYKTVFGSIVQNVGGGC